MLKLDLDKHCRVRNLPQSAAYLRQRGFSHWVSNRLANNKNQSISFYDLERLCTVFKCTPSELFEWVPDSAEEEKDASHPLASLKKDKAIEKGIKDLSFSQLKEIAQILSEKK